VIEYATVQDDVPGDDETFTTICAAPVPIEEVQPTPPLRALPDVSARRHHGRKG